MPSKDHAKLREKYQRTALRIKYRTLSRYSEGAPACACCGESCLEFLALDHINGGGNKERKALGLVGGTTFFRHLAREGFPPGYRVLCHNCNSALGHYGYCPHASPDRAAELAATLPLRQKQRHLNSHW